MLNKKKIYNDKLRKKSETLTTEWWWSMYTYEYVCSAACEHRDLKKPYIEAVQIAINS